MFDRFSSTIGVKGNGYIKKIKVMVVTNTQNKNSFLFSDIMVQDGGNVTVWSPNIIEMDGGEVPKIITKYNCTECVFIDDIIEKIKMIRETMETL